MATPKLPASLTSSRGAVLVDAQLSKTVNKKLTRAGALNYSTEDFTAMLAIVEEEKSLGANHWVVIATKFTVWAADNSRPLRDQDYLKKKFDKLADMKKKTGDPSWPEPVRRAKLIARAIHNKCAAMTLGESSDGNEENGQGMDVSDGSEETPGSSTVGEPRKKRKTGATGTPSKAKNDCVLLEHIGSMAEHLGKISYTISKRTVVLVGFVRWHKKTPTHSHKRPSVEQVLENLCREKGVAW